MISQVNSVTTVNTNIQRVPKKDLDMQDFIQLFITQLRYQDPMNPIENNEMATQLALFNQVDQLFKINETLNVLAYMANFMANSLDLAYISNLIGKKIKIATDIGRVENGEFLGGEFTLKEPAEKVEIIIKNSQGEIIYKLELSNLQKGTHKINWDAINLEGEKVSDGNYTFSIIAYSGEESKNITPFMIGKITGVKLGEIIKFIVNETVEILPEDIQEIIGG
uniref:Basal-body rod modification protein FlgD n=1 Tax=Thermodesulfobacterium geofontis TaxID=1295609 RepID=A0A7V5XHG1_9BACT